MPNRLLTVAAIMIAGVLLLVWHELRPRPTVVSGYIEADEIRVGSRVGGRVKEVFAIEGAAMKAGQVLIRLEPFDLEQQLAQANAELAAANAVASKLVAGFRAEEIAAAQADRDRAQAALDEAVAGARPQEIKYEEDMLGLALADLERVNQTFARISGLAKTGDATPEDSDRATSDRKAAAARVDASRARLDLLRAGTRVEQVAQHNAQLAAATAHLDLLKNGQRREDITEARARVDALQARVQSITTQIAELEVRAPCACVVEAIDLQPGDLIGAGAPVISLMNLDALWIRAYLPESWLGWVHVNDQVQFAVDSFPHQTFAARITFVSRNAEFTPSNIQTPEERSKQVYRMKVAIERDRDRFRPGMAADISIEKPRSP